MSKRKIVVFWNPSTATDQENLRWAWLRAVEWGNWPLFIAQPIVPILLLYCSWWKVIIALLIISWFWCLIRYKYINIKLIDLGSLLVHLKWPISIIVGIIFIRKHNYWMAALSGLWPLVNLILLLLAPGTKIGIIQKTIMKMLGYEQGGNLRSQPL